MRRLLLAAIVGLTLADIGMLAAVSVAGVPTAPVAKVTYQGTRPTIVLSWTDTNTAVARTDISRRSTGTDTVWRRVGYNLVKNPLFYDPFVLPNKKYIYRLRDSVAGAALTAWSDTAYITTTRLP